MTTVISSQLLKALTHLTGAIYFDSALRMVTQDAIAHRLESIAKQLHALAQKYGMSLEQFDVCFQAEALPKQYSYEVEDALSFASFLRQAEETRQDGPDLRMVVARLPSRKRRSWQAA
jgi:hypothetical protein